MTYALIGNLRYYLISHPHVAISGHVITDRSIWRSPIPLLDFTSGVIIRRDVINAIIPHLSTHPSCQADDRLLRYAFAQCFDSALRIKAIDASDTTGGGHRLLSEGPKKLFSNDHGDQSLLSIFRALITWQVSILPLSIFSDHRFLGPFKVLQRLRHHLWITTILRFLFIGIPDLSSSTDRYRFLVIFAYLMLLLGHQRLIIDLYA